MTKRLLSSKDIEEILDIIDFDECLTDGEKQENKLHDIIRSGIKLHYSYNDYKKLYFLTRELMCVYTNTLENKAKDKLYYFIETLENYSHGDEVSILMLDEEYKPFVINLNHFAHEFFEADLEKAKQYIARRKDKLQASDDIKLQHTLYGEVYIDGNGNMWASKNRTIDEVKKLSKSLINCRDCYECDNCVNCEKCYKCSNCNNCIECKTCVYCVDCHDCYECDNCERCENCLMCERCKECRVCEYLTQCRNCLNCIDCHNSKNLDTQGGLDDTEH